MGTKFFSFTMRLGWAAFVIVVLALPNTEALEHSEKNIRGKAIEKKSERSFLSHLRHMRKRETEIHSNRGNKDSPGKSAKSETGNGVSDPSSDSKVSPGKSAKSETGNEVSDPSSDSKGSPEKSAKSETGSEVSDPSSDSKGSPGKSAKSETGHSDNTKTMRSKPRKNSTDKSAKASVTCNKPDKSTICASFKNPHVCVTDLTCKYANACLAEAAGHDLANCSY